MISNLDIWDKLGRTDPDHTKKFTRGGGFKGTAVKPIYTAHKMTETFGPCGSGWGYSEPTFQLVPGSDGQTAVFCWVTLWYAKPEGGRSEPIPGVGGDFVVKKFSSGLTTDDEAFKKAFTDALGNAMKNLGMSADVHMGLFDDNKYVSELRSEFADLRSEFTEHRPAGRSAITVNSPARLHTNGKPVARTRSQEMASEMSAALWKISGPRVSDWLKLDAVKRDLEALDQVDRQAVEALAEERAGLQ
jgi:hypothetical protein